MSHLGNDEHIAGGLGVAGSNPAATTNEINDLIDFGLQLRIHQHSHSIHGLGAAERQRPLLRACQGVNCHCTSKKELVHPLGAVLGVEIPFGAGAAPRITGPKPGRFSASTVSPASPASDKDAPPSTTKMKGAQ